MVATNTDYGFGQAFNEPDIEDARDIITSACDLAFLLDMFQSESGLTLAKGGVERIYELSGGRDIEDISDVEIAFIMGSVMVRYEPA